jgi:type IV pilus assembly protein PilE
METTTLVTAREARVLRARQRGRGFTLVELLIVVGVIAIVAALGVPSLIHARRAAHSASAVSSLRLIHSSQYSYRNSTGNYGDLAALNPFIGDPLLRAGRKSYYAFTVTPDAARPSEDYAASATPADPQTVITWRHYFVDASGVLRWKAGASADSSSAPVDQ